jgi:hypothetical protein
MTFDPTADTIHIETYSPTVEGGRFINKPTSHADNQPNEPNGNELTLPYDMDAGLPFQTIGTTTAVPSGTQTCMSWPGLTANLQHEWKVEVSDATATTTQRDPELHDFELQRQRGLRRRQRLHGRHVRQHRMCPRSHPWVLQRQRRLC